MMYTRARMKRFKSINQCSASESESRDDAKKMKQKLNSRVISKLLLLPQELMIDILIRLPVECLVNSARYVCKPWATLIASSYFVDAHLHRASSEPRLLVVKENYYRKSYFLHIKDKDIPSGQFERIDFGFRIPPPKIGCLVESCDGIMLLNDCYRVCFVINPVLKCCLKITPLPSSKVFYKWSDEYDRLSLTRVPRTAKFKLFFVDCLEISTYRCYVFYVLTIGIDNSWREIGRKEATHGRELRVLQRPVYNRGNDLYWITSEGVTLMDIDREIIIAEYPLPPPPVEVVGQPPAQFLWMGNCLSAILDTSHRTRFQIYILHIGLGEWILYHDMGPLDYLAAWGHKFKSHVEIWSVRFLFWINHQLFFLGSGDQRGVTIRSIEIYLRYNVKTRRLSKFEGIDKGSQDIFHHTNSLVPLPTTATKLGSPI